MNFSELKDAYQKDVYGAEGHCPEWLERLSECEGLDADLNIVTLVRIIEAMRQDYYSVSTLCRDYAVFVNATKTDPTIAHWIVKELIPLCYDALEKAYKPEHSDTPATLTKSIVDIGSIFTFLDVVGTVPLQLHGEEVQQLWAYFKSSQISDPQQWLRQYYHLDAA